MDRRLRSPPASPTPRRCPPPPRVSAPREAGVLIMPRARRVIYQGAQNSERAAPAGRLRRHDRRVPPAAAGAPGAAATKASGWPERCARVRAFLRECSYKRLRLAQLLGRHGVFLTGATQNAPGRAAIASRGQAADRESRAARWAIAAEAGPAPWRSPQHRVLTFNPYLPLTALCTVRGAGWNTNRSIALIGSDGGCPGDGGAGCPGRVWR